MFYSFHGGLQWSILFYWYLPSKEKIYFEGADGPATGPSIWNEQKNSDIFFSAKISIKQE
ncbi:MAG: hypothetical protein B7Z75_13290 [Acidocella sp. 20-57-95]|nr:MAG: hypothetical protein B7Z75_13290 [Acidocella sp. 20-57-95]